MKWSIDGGRPNRSFTYILPMLGESRTHFPGIFHCFSKCEDKPDLNSHIFLLYKRSIPKEQEDKLLGHPNFIEKYEPDDYHNMYIFEVPEYWKEEYNFFLSGRYSMMNDRYKKHIMGFHNLNARTNPVAGVLYRKEEYYKEWEKKIGQTISRNQEIGNLPDMSAERYSEKMKAYKTDYSEVSDLWKKEA